MILFLIGAEAALINETFAESPNETVFVACIFNAFVAIIGAFVWEANRE